MAPEKDILPVIPLRNIVVFPGMIIPLYVGRKNSLEAMESASKSDSKKVLLIAQKDPELENPGDEDFYSTGAVAKIVQLLRLPNGTVKVLVEGLKRAEITAVQDSGVFLEAQYQEVEDVCAVDEKLGTLVKQVVEKFDRLVKTNKKIPTETLMSIINVEDPGRLSDLVASYLTLQIEEKQKLLNINDVQERLKLIQTYCLRETGLIEVEKNLDSSVHDQIEKVQKEYMLKEKLKAIQKELGEESAGYSEVDEYRQKIAQSGIPQDVEKKALRELQRLEKMQSMSSEAGVIRTYLDWVLDLPWQRSSDSSVDLQKVQEILDQDHYGLKKVKDRIVEYFAVYQNTKQQAGSIILLVGPPGVGKTSIAQSIARSLNREFFRISLGGMRDEAELRGHRRTYVGAMPGKIIQALSKVKTKNPLILLDEIDKLSRDYKGDPSAVLMEILDPAQNKNFTDTYMEVPFDLSNVVFIGTANTAFDISKPLLDRMEVIRLSGYSEEEKVAIAKKYLVPKILKQNGVSSKEFCFTDVGIKTIVEDHTRESGLRELERLLAEVSRKYVRNKLEKKKVYKKVSKHNLHYYLGEPKYSKDKVLLKDEVGVVNGLAWTESGGEVMPVEVSILNGKGNLTITGHLGEVMQESAKAALSFVRSRYQELGLAEDFYKNVDIHIHVPEGAIAKDGPSAGITMAVGLASALSGLPVRGLAAMTGEISLRGRVMPIGGLKEKVLAAMRYGLNTIILPYENRAEIQDLPLKARKKIKFFPVKTMDEVFFYAIKGYQKTNVDLKIKPEIVQNKQDNSRDLPRELL